MKTIFYEIKNNKIINIQRPKNQSALDTLKSGRIENTDYFLNDDIDLEQDGNYNGLFDEFGSEFYEMGSGGIPVLISEPNRIDDLKLNYINKCSQMSFERREEKLSEYKLLNAALDIYDATTKQQYKDFVNLFRNEFYRLKEEIENAAITTEAQIITIVETAAFENYNL